MKLIKILFFIINILLIIFYIYPGSIFGCFFYSDCSIQPQLTKDFIISSNHFYVFLVISLYGFQFSDMFGNIAGVIVSFIIIKLINYWRKK